MKRVLLGMAILITMAFGFASNASAVDYSLSDPKTLASLFEQVGVVGHQLTGTEVAALGDNIYEVLLFSAYSAGRGTDIYVGNQRVDVMNNVGNGNIGKSYGEFALDTLSIVRDGNTFNFTDTANYVAKGWLQAYMIDEEVTINGVLYGVGSIFIGYEDGIDFDYNDVVISLRALSSPAVPIPAAAWLLGTGLAGLAALRRKGASAVQ